jgi:hypothetical protein
LRAARGKLTNEPEDKFILFDKFSEVKKVPPRGWGTRVTRDAKLPVEYFF